MLFVAIIVTVSNNCDKNGIKNCQISLTQISQMFIFYYIFFLYMYVWVLFSELFKLMMPCTPITSVYLPQNKKFSNKTTIIKIWKLTFILCYYLIYRPHLYFFICPNYVLIAKENPRWCIIIAFMSQSLVIWNNF